MEESTTKARIFFGNSLPKNWRLNSALQTDTDYQKLRDDWDDETNPELKEQKAQLLRDYKAKARKRLNLPED